MTKQITANISISCKWWVKPYLQALFIFCTFTGKRPDENKLAKIMKKGLITNVEICDRAS